MTVTEVLNDPLFSNSEIAMQIWPEIKNRKYAGSRLSSKLTNNAGQRITENDLKNISDLFEKKYKINLDCI